MRKENYMDKTDKIKDTLQKQKLKKKQIREVKIEKFMQGKSKQTLV